MSLANLWSHFGYHVLDRLYYFHFFRDGQGHVQLRTGAKYGKGQVLGEMEENVRGASIPELVRQNADKIGQRKHCWSYPGCSPAIGEPLDPQGEGFHALYIPRIGEIWTRLGDGFDLEILEPVWSKGLRKLMVICRECRSGRVTCIPMQPFFFPDEYRKKADVPSLTTQRHAFIGDSPVIEMIAVALLFRF